MKGQLKLRPGVYVVNEMLESQRRKSPEAKRKNDRKTLFYFFSHPNKAFLFRKVVEKEEKEESR